MRIRRGRGDSPTDEAGARQLPHGRGRGDSPRPWHVRFKGNLCAALPKVACNSVDRIFLITQKRWNCNDTISIYKRSTGKLHATLLGNHDDAPYTIRPRPGQVEKHANAKPPPGSTGTTPAAPLSLGGITPQQAENQHTTTRKEAASTSLHKTRDLTHPLRGIAPVTRHCTRYAALHPLRGAAPEQKGCNAYRSGAMPTDRVHDPIRHKLTCGPARKDVHGPDRLGWAWRRSPNSWLGLAARSKQLAGPGGGRA